MKIIYAGEFVKAFKKLPVNVQKLYRKQESIFQKNWKDPRLHTKKLIGHASPFSFRVTREYRVLFSFIDKDTVLMATIGHRSQIYD